MTGQQEQGERVWVVTTWEHVHDGATVRPPEHPDSVSHNTSAVRRRRMLPYPHEIIETQFGDLDPRAPVEILIDIPTSRALAVLAAAGLAPQVIFENESESPS